MAKRLTNPDEPRRVSERLFNSGRDIKDRDSFNVAYAKMIQNTDLTKRQLNFRDDVFKEYSKEHVIDKAERQMMKEGRIERVALQSRRLDTPARVKTKSGFKVVYAEKTYVMVKGKEQLRFRDSKGRFVSVKK